MTDLEGRAAVVTGGARGIGLAIGAALAREGAAVVLADLDGDEAAAAAAGLAGKAIGIACDVREPEAVEAAVAACTAAFGSLDVMVNNAGVTRDATIRRMTVEDFDLVISVHLRGTWLGTRAAAAVMREQGRGSIVNISSISGKVGMAGQTNYSAAKAGIVGLTKAAAKELAHLGVRVNAIQPGIVRTDMTAALREDIWEQKLAEVPLRRAGEVQDIAEAALFLATDRSSYMTGTVLEVTGGRFM